MVQTIMMPTKISIDGLPGSGKSTIEKKLEQLGYGVYQEDIEDWGKILEQFYCCPKRWSLTLQLAILQSLSEQKQEINKLPDPFVFIERSPLSALCFVRNAVDTGLMSKMELDLYSKFFRKLAWKPHLIIYIDTPVDECYARIRKRNRPGEEHITKQYLHNIRNQYKHLLIEDAVEHAIPVIRIDGNQSPDDVLSSVQRHLSPSPRLSF